MKTFKFVATCNQGMCSYSGESYVEVELTDEEATRLVEYGTNQDEIVDFELCEELADIYEKVYEVAVEQMTQEYLESDEVDEDCVENPDFRIDDIFECTVNFPEEFE